MKFKVLSNLKHNGKDYSIGDTIALPEEEAEKLVSINVLEKIETIEKVKAEEPVIAIPVKPKRKRKPRK